MYRWRPLEWQSGGESYVNERTVGVQQTAWNFVRHLPNAPWFSPALVSRIPHCMHSRTRGEHPGHDGGVVDEGHIRGCHPPSHLVPTQVAHGRNHLPKPLAGVIWWAPDDSSTAVRVPFYSSATEIPAGYGDLAGQVPAAAVPYAVNADAIKMNMDSAFWVGNHKCRLPGWR